jgi:hypothetical protein
MAKANRKNTPKLSKTPPFDPLRTFVEPIVLARQAIQKYFAVPRLTKEERNRVLTGLKRLGLVGQGGKTGAVARPRGRPRKFDHNAIADVAKDLAEWGVTTLEDFVDRVGGTLETQGKPVPRRTVLKKICRPVYLRAKGGITD